MTFVYRGKVRITLTSKLGSGGEGSVYTIDREEDLVAKIYHAPVSNFQQEKLHEMIRQKTDQLLSIAAWPVETLRSSPEGPVVGFLMPRIDGYKPIHEVYSPKSRRVEFPEATWKFLIHVANNIARAFAIIHQAGLVIGDVNHGNILVSQNGTVRLIDCDSFQINTERTVFYCKVGVAEYTPPELQGLKLSETARTTNHDAFGLAVLVFHLLFMGRHPFAGTYLGTEQLPIDTAIQEYRFAYSAQAKALKMKSPPFTLPTNAITYTVFAFFEQAFTRGDSPDKIRPKADMWVAALGELTRQLKKCSKSEGHLYLSHLQDCPWCDLETKLGVNPFLILGSPMLASNFDLNLVWQTIQAVPAPGIYPEVEMINGIVEPSPEAIKSFPKSANQIVSVLIGLLALTIGFELHQYNIMWYIWVAGGLLSTYVWNYPRKFINTFKRKLAQCQSQYNVAQQEWQRVAVENKFALKLEELERLRSSYLQLDSLRTNEMEKLKRKQKQQQLTEFLEKHKIEDAIIEDIGSGRKAMLQSYGIENAADVKTQKVGMVPGFGEALTFRMHSWQKSIEFRFVFDPSQGISPRDIAELDRKIHLLRTKLESDLLAAPSQLAQIKNDMLMARAIVKPKVEAALINLKQAEIDLQYVKG